MSIKMTEGFATPNEPFMVREACHALLKPGLQLWLETPNIDSFGYARFQKIWRGLKTPRHLVLFNRQSLSQAFVRQVFMRYTAAPVRAPVLECSRPASPWMVGVIHIRRRQCPSR